MAVVKAEGEWGDTHMHGLDHLVVIAVLASSRRPLFGRLDFAHIGLLTWTSGWVRKRLTTSEPSKGYIISYILYFIICILFLFYYVVLFYILIETIWL